MSWMKQGLRESLEWEELWSTDSCRLWVGASAEPGVTQQKSQSTTWPVAARLGPVNSDSFSRWSAMLAGMAGCSPRKGLWCWVNWVGWGLSESAVWSSRAHQANQTQIWLCGGGLNTGNMAPTCRLHGRRTPPRKIGGCPQSLTAKPHTSVCPLYAFDVTKLTIPPLLPKVSACK